MTSLKNIQTDILDIAEKSLRANIITSPDGPLLVAGAHQFRTAWVRDFCFSVPGLLALGEKDLVKNQLLLIYKFRSPEGLLPRGLDGWPPKMRVILHTVLRFLPQILKNLSDNRPLRPEYLGEHVTPAMDSNILTLWATQKYLQAHPDHELQAVFDDNKKITHDFYQKYFSKNLFKQPAFSDWQDSADRSGYGFYFHILYLQIYPDKELIKQVFESFYRKQTGLFSQFVDKDIFPLESNLWAVESNLFKDYIARDKLYTNLLHSGLWNSVGIPVHPQYPDTQISWMTKFVGLRHYHDHFRWSWLVAEALKISRLMGDKDQETRLSSQLYELLQHSNRQVSEIYEAAQSADFKRGFYHSERPFSWGSAKIIEALC